MPDFRTHWVDAFSDRPFGGNGCAVVHDAAHLDAETCMAFVRETGLVECTFLGPSDMADLRVRYFLASREIPFAGHPTVASVLAAHAAGTVQDGDMVLETQAGCIPVHLDAARDMVTMTQNAPEFGARPDPALVAKAIGVQVDDFAAPPQLVSTGLPFIITLLKDMAAIKRAALDIGAFTELAASMGQNAIDVMEPFLVVREGATQHGDTFARLLLAPPSPPEDPFTGSASGAMAAYLWEHGLIDAPSFVAEQGHHMGRPGRAQLEVLGDAGAISGVKVSGSGHILMSGTLHL